MRGYLQTNKLPAWVLWMSGQVGLHRPMANCYSSPVISIELGNCPCEVKTFNHKNIIPALKKTHRRFHNRSPLRSFWHAKAKARLLKTIVILYQNEDGVISSTLWSIGFKWCTSKLIHIIISFPKENDGETLVPGSRNALLPCKGECSLALNYSNSHINTKTGQL